MKNKGFTLIELIVVMAVFLLVIGAAIGIFISIVQNQKRVLAEQQLLNQVSYAEEHISKALRMAVVDDSGNCLGTGNAGYIYLLDRPYNNCSQGNDPECGFFTGIKFLDQSDADLQGNPACQEFYLDTSTTPYVLREIKTYYPYDQISDDHATALTPTSLKINFIKFGINGTDGSIAHSPNSNGNYAGATNSDTGIQPRVTILFDVKIPGDDQEPDRIMQTTVSQRNLNK